MGKKRNRVKALFFGILTTLLLLAGCALERPTKIFSYEGAYIYKSYKKNKEIDGKWRAIFIGDKLDKCYIYTSFGFPLVAIEVTEDNRILLNQEPIELKEGDSSFFNVITFAITNLRKIMDAREGTKLKIEDIELKKIDNHRIKVEHPQKWVLYVNIENVQEN
ncbi:MAG: hypothetical protein ACP5JZ_00575 [Thermosulfidibacteraceae bacterium]|jgi:hypothetical protein